MKYVVLFVVLCISCDFFHEKSKTITANEEAEVYTFLIDHFSTIYPIPPPPPSINDTTYVPPKIVPKAFSRVGIRPKKFSISKEDQERVEAYLNELNVNIDISNTNESDHTLNLKSLNTSHKYKATYVTEKSATLFSTINVLLNFSPVNFSKDHTKATVIIGVSKGKLNGFSAILVLEKVENSWKIVAQKMLTIS